MALVIAFFAMLAVGLLVFALRTPGRYATFEAHPSAFILGAHDSPSAFQLLRSSARGLWTRTRSNWAQDRRPALVWDNEARR